MPNFSFVPLEGTIQNIRPFGDECCSSLVTLQTSEGTVTVVVSSDTYVISEVRLRRGMTVAAFYDAQVPYLLYDSTKEEAGPEAYNEKTAYATGRNWPDGYQLIGHLLQEDIC